MQIDIQARDFLLTESLRAHVERRLQFALNRFQGQEPRILVRLSDVNGPRGGQDKHCHIRIAVDGLPDIVIEDIEADLYVAVDRAVERAGRTLGRYLQRARGVFDNRVVWSDK